MRWGLPLEVPAWEAEKVAAGVKVAVVKVAVVTGRETWTVG